MREEKFHIYLNDDEYSRLIQSLIRLKNSLTAQGRCTDAVIRYNKLRKLKKDKNRHGLQTSGRMKLPHTILRGVCKPCPRKLYS